MFNLKHLSDAPKDKPEAQAVCDRERQKALKKRCKKLRQRMAQRSVMKYLYILWRARPIPTLCLCIFLPVLVVSVEMFSSDSVNTCHVVIRKD